MSDNKKKKNTPKKATIRKLKPRNAKAISSKARTTKSYKKTSKVSQASKASSKNSRESIKGAVVSLKDSINKIKHERMKSRRPKVWLGAATVVIASVALGSYLEKHDFSDIANIDIKSVVSRTIGNYKSYNEEEGVQIPLQTTVSSNSKIALLDKNTSNTISSNPLLVSNSELRTTKMPKTPNHDASMEEQVIYLQQTMQNALSDIQKTRTDSNKRLEMFTDVLVTLEKTLNTIQQGLENSQQDLARNIVNDETISNYHLFSQKLAFLERAYSQGNINPLVFEDIAIYASQTLNNKQLIGAIKQLQQVTPEGKVVTKNEVMLIVNQLQRYSNPQDMPAPTPLKDQLSQTSGTPKQETAQVEVGTPNATDNESLANRAKKAFSSWVSISTKEPVAINNFDANSPWITSLDKLQLILARGEINQARKFITIENTLNNIYTQELKLALDLHIIQQTAINSLKAAYISAIQIINNRNIDNGTTIYNGRNDIKNISIKAGEVSNQLPKATHDELDKIKRFEKFEKMGIKLLNSTSTTINNNTSSKVNSQ